MPAQQGRRRDQERRPPLPAEAAGPAWRATPGPPASNAAAPPGVSARRAGGEHGDLDVLLVGRGAEPDQVEQAADDQEANLTGHPDDIGSYASALLRHQILSLHPSPMVDRPTPWPRLRLVWDFLPTIYGHLQAKPGWRRSKVSTSSGDCLSPPPCHRDGTSASSLSHSPSTIQAVNGYDNADDRGRPTERATNTGRLDGRTISRHNSRPCCRGWT